MMILKTVGDKSLGKNFAFVCPKIIYFNLNRNGYKDTEWKLKIFTSININIFVNIRA